MRAFLAAPADEATRRAFAAAADDLTQGLGLSGNRHVRLTWVRPEVVHLTLKFLGDIDEPAAGRLESAISRALRGMGPAELPVDSVGAFPRADYPRALWIGPAESWSASDSAARLIALHAAIEDACAAAGFARDPSPWRPHLTMARVRSGEREVGRALRSTGALERALAIRSMPIDQIVLMKSELLPAGPKHTALWVHRLAAASSVP